MAQDDLFSEHQRYSQRLSEVEERRAKSAQPDQPQERIGHKNRGIKVYRYLTNGERVLKLILLFGGVLLLMLYVISPLSKIDRVTVKGNHDLSATAVEQATRVQPGRYIWGVMLSQRSASRQANRRNPQVATVSYHLRGPRAVQIVVRENPVVGTVEIGQRDYNVLANGQLKAAKGDQSKIQYQAFDHHRQQLKTTAMQLGQLKPVVRNGISTVCYRPQKNAPNRLVIYMRDGNTVYANLNTVGKKLAYYPAIAATMKEPGVVDLQVGAFSYSYKSREQ
ncbi:cell division protein FtsQ/DivIB [Limosilactobacillus antri]|uniref:cell division protein FtsQ/DivIB n=1 Tax=Limosilactobacillus antri TaxID=227943 RepID=UPI001F56A01D|nr:FtsQ-type POTRA domain-containing protein [Limosilactobacillus antri]